MEHLRLGRSGLCVPRVGVGTVTFGGHWGPMSERVARDVILRAVEVGLDFFDTADCYGLGESERLLASALGDRADVTISSKFGVRWDDGGKTWRDSSPRYARAALGATLRRLGRRELPLYYVHWTDGVTPFEETFQVLEELQAEGLIRNIGLSNPTLAELDHALRRSCLAAVQCQFSIVNQRANADVLARCRDAGVPVLSWGSLAQGLLAGSVRPGRTWEGMDRRQKDMNFQGERLVRNQEVAEHVRRVAERLGRTPAQVAMRWLLDTPGIGAVLVGPKSVEQVEEYVGALDWKLPRDDYAALGAVGLWAEA